MTDIGAPPRRRRRGVGRLRRSARIVRVDEVSANVSTNRVYRVHLDDGSTSICKVSSYGSYFLFVEDHDRLSRCARLLDGTRFGGMLADVWTADATARPDLHLVRPDMWAVFYDDVPRGEALPRVLTTDQIENLGREIAEFHLACTDLAPRIPAGLEDDQERRDPPPRPAREPVRAAQLRPPAGGDRRAVAAHPPVPRAARRARLRRVAARSRC